MKLCHRLRDARKAAGMTQERAAYWAESSRENISDLEQGKHSPSLSMLIRLADTYGVTVSMLLGDQPMTMEGLTRKERAVVELMRSEA